MNLATHGLDHQTACDVEPHAGASLAVLGRKEWAEDVVGIYGGDPSTIV